MRPGSVCEAYGRGQPWGDHCKQIKKSCLFKYIEVEGIFYKRNTTIDEDEVWYDSNGKLTDTPEKEAPYDYCGCCGVKYGLTHHMGCDQESCPKCGIQ